MARENIKSGMVRAEGFEPPRPKSLEPKSSASTNSATPARRWCRTSAGSRGAALALRSALHSTEHSESETILAPHQAARVGSIILPGAATIDRWLEFDVASGGDELRTLDLSAPLEAPNAA
jgi:hypothetical protein